MEDILREARRRQERVYLKAVYKNKMMQIDTDRILYISLRKRGLPDMAGPGAGREPGELQFTSG